VLDKLIRSRGAQNNKSPSDASAKKNSATRDETFFKSVNRSIETTLIIPRSLTLIKWSLNFNQDSYRAQSGGAYSANITDSTLSAMLSIIFGATENLNLLFEAPYRIYQKERFSTTDCVTTLKTKGFEDFKVGFSSRLLSQKTLFDLILNGGWKSGFMPDDLPVVNKNGGGGSGSHDFYLGLIAGKSFTSISPHLTLLATRIGSATRHYSDNSGTEEYSSHFKWYLVAGIELPQFMPLIVLNPFAGYSHEGSQKVNTITAPVKEEIIEPARTISLGAELFLYRGRQSYIFKYSFNKMLNRAEQQYWISDHSGHKFTILLRF